MPPVQQAPPGRNTDQPDELQKLTKLIKEKFELADKTQKYYRDRWDGYYGLYRNYRTLKSRTATNQPDRDAVMQDAKRTWGAELFVPKCFTTIETIVPRVISNDPKMVVHAKDEDSHDAAAAIADLLQAQQRDISYDLKLQAVARSGLKYGLGVGKTFWDKQSRKVLRNEPGNNPTGIQTIEREIVRYEGPQFEPIDIWDFFWDPAARDIETASFVIHRTWRNQDYVKGKVEKGDWLQIDLEAAEGLATQKGQGEVWAGRQKAAGIDKYDTNRGKLHEVWEYHDRERVITILDRELVVQNDVTPFYHRELPFQIYRPTIQENEFVGIGEIEPIAHLQYELNSLRSQRRDNATLVLQKAFLYAEGFVDPANLKIGPGKGIPIKGTSIRDVIQPLEFPEIPASSYKEEEAINNDFESTSGISEAIQGGGGDASADTATGIQLIQQAAGVRIKLKAKNLMAETVRPAARQFLELDRQHILGPQTVRVDDPGSPNGVRFAQIGPEELRAEVEDPIPDAASTEPDNPPARQSAAMTLYQTLEADDRVDKEKLARHLLREYDVPNADSFVIPQGLAQVNPQVLGQALADLGVDQDIVIEALDQAFAAATGQEPLLDPGDQQALGQNGGPPQEGPPQDKQQGPPEKQPQRERQ